MLVGETVIACVVAPPGDHEYVSLPVPPVHDALSVADWPESIVFVVGETTQVSGGFTVTVAEAVVLPPLASPTVTV